MVNTPLPLSLKSEAKKAAKILRDFTIPGADKGPDSLIPAGILARAKGLAIITVFKAGFLVTARGGSGIVIARLGHQLDYSNDWSAPSAIGMAGLGGGFEIGLEVTDFVIILNTDAAVDAFSKGGNLTLGGNFTIALGPVGRNLEGDIAIRSPAAIYTYSKTKGIFAGISVEGSALIERKDANRKFYGRDIRAFEILAGKVDPPEECEALYQVMKEHQEMAVKAALKLAKKEASKHAIVARDRFVDYAGFSLPSSSNQSKPRERSSSFSQKTSISRSTVKNETSSKAHSRTPELGKKSMQVVHRTTITTKVTHTPLVDPNRRSMPDLLSLKSSLSAQSFSLPGVIPAIRTPARAVAEFPYEAQLACDLSFRAGDEIAVLTRTHTQDDWWEGKCHGRCGLFPANYVRLL